MAVIVPQGGDLPLSSLGDTHGRQLGAVTTMQMGQRVRQLPRGLGRARQDKQRRSNGMEERRTRHGHNVPRRCRTREEVATAVNSARSKCGSVYNDTEVSRP